MISSLLEQLMIIVIFSIGQFISSDLNILKLGFQNWFEAQERTVTGDEVWTWLCTQLPELRIAQINLGELCKRFNEHFLSAINFEEFQQIFNSMSKIDAATLDKIVQFKEFLDARKHIKFILVAHTNYSHLNYILDQLQAVLPESHASVIGGGKKLSDTSQILFAPSMTSKCVDHPDTLKYALKQLQPHGCEQLVSFLNTIKSFENPDNAFGTMTFSYHDAGTKLEPVKVLELLANLHSVSDGLSY